MNKTKQKFFNDYLEIITFFVFLLTLLVIYVPSLIWEEEDMYKSESRSRMQALYNVENFHNILIGKYEEDGLKAVTLVNAVRDSVMADSTFLGDQSVKYFSGNNSFPTGDCRLSDKCFCIEQIRSCLFSRPNNVIGRTIFMISQYRN